MFFVSAKPIPGQSSAPLNLCANSGHGAPHPPLRQAAGCYVTFTYCGGMLRKGTFLILFRMYIFIFGGVFMKQYQVLTLKDKWFSGKFDPQKLQEALNSYAQQGWRLVSCATADIPGFGSARQEFIAVLERDV